jgi:hypothetical protein
MSDYVMLGQTFKNDSVMKPQKKEVFSEESYDFPVNKLIGGQPDDAAE